VAYPTVAEIRARVDALVDANAFPDAVIQDLIDEFIELAEDYCGVAFIARAGVVEAFTAATSGSKVILPYTEVTAITALTVDGVAVPAASYRLLNGGRSGVVIIETGWGAEQAISITVTHGLATTPKVVSRACREYVRACAQADRSDMPRDIIGSTGANGVSYRYSTPDASAGRPTGYMEVDRLLNMAPNYRGVAVA
jgi:hypothetical protein